MSCFVWRCIRYMAASPLLYMAQNGVLDNRHPEGRGLLANKDTEAYAWPMCRATIDVFNFETSLTNRGRRVHVRRTYPIIQLLTLVPTVMNSTTILQKYACCLRGDNVVFRCKWKGRGWNSVRSCYLQHVVSPPPSMSELWSPSRIVETTWSQSPIFPFIRSCLCLDDFST